MKALVLAEGPRLILTTRSAPRCAAPDDVVVDVVQTGICGTDRGVLVGKFPAEVGTIMGHEAVGIVAATGPAVHTLQVGDRVIVNPTLWCGHCPPCRQGRLNFCVNKAGTEVGIDRDGSFAEQICLAERFLYKIPAGMSFDRAVVVEPLACVLNNLDAAPLRPGTTIIVLGGGPIGLVCAMAARVAGCQVTLVEADERRRLLAVSDVFQEEPFSGISVVEPASGDLRDGADVVVDTVGTLLERACELAGTGGTVIVMGFNESATATLRPLRLLQKALRIVGAGDYNSLDFPRAIELARGLPLERLVTHRFALEDYQSALSVIAADGAGSGPDAEYTALKTVLVSSAGALR
jgi:threonine dehydrogenase-like Zn-dependent dehydrogenase